MFSLDRKTTKDLKDFFALCFNRFTFGDEKYGKRYEEIDLFDEMITELADVVNYAFLQYLKIKKMKESLKNEKKEKSENKRQ